MTAVAVPLTTEGPEKDIILCFSKRSFGIHGPAFFSTGNGSPVRADWLTKRSREESRRASAGTISPAASVTMSPGTRPVIGSSFCTPSLITAAFCDYLLFEKFGSVFCFVFLEKIQRNACNDNDKNNGCRSNLTDKHRNGRRKDEDDNHGVFEMHKKLDYYRLLEDLGILLGPDGSRYFSACEDVSPWTVVPRAEKISSSVAVWNRISGTGFAATSLAGISSRISNKPSRELCDYTIKGECVLLNHTDFYLPAHTGQPKMRVSRTSSRVHRAEISVI